MPDTSNGLDPRYAAAIAVAREAGALALDFFVHRASLDVRNKGPQDVVTEADIAVEDLIRTRLLEAFPDDAFLGEESAGGEHAVRDQCLWIVDPIDGTQEFARGVRAWCVVIALVVNGSAQFGIVFDPCADELFEARRGRGATLNGAGIAVATRSSLADGVVTVEYSSRTSVGDLLHILKALLEQGGTFARSGSGALALCYVACGRSLGFIEMHMFPWDCVAALLIVSEAGGRATDFLGDGSLEVGGPVVAGPPALFERLTALMPTA